MDYDYEKLNVFYLGKTFDIARGEVEKELVLYDTKDLTTHAVIVGMTGSGKTGLGVTLLEEAAIDGIPSLVIDPKGDLANLLLTFPKLKGSDFSPWIEPGEASRKGMEPGPYAESVAKNWKAGLAAWGQQPDRIARFENAVERAIYTPGSDAGLPLCVLRSLDAPPKAIRESTDDLRERISSAVSGLLTLLGVDADPIKSREHILLSNILDAAWREGKSLDLAGLIRAIQQPAFTRIGIMDLETFFPAKDRFGLAMTFNNVLASPSFAGWLEGEPLDIQKLLYTPEGKPRMAILSIAHLSESERMFFVTLLLNEVIAWMRSRPGTSSLRALLYMDEVFGYLPPTANPPSKLPMLTLLKQARAFGLGLVLATQNPVDLDYKALSNAGTWLIGRLQTERDKLRVIEGLESASASAGHALDRSQIDKILSSLGSRVFLMNNVHEDAPIVFQSRWALSYLRGPLTKQQIRTLMEPLRRGSSPDETAPAATAPASATPASGRAAEPPVVPHGIEQRYLAPDASVRNAEWLYQPALLGVAKVHYVDAKTKTDVWIDLVRYVRVEGSVPDSCWDEADELPAKRQDALEPDAEGGACYAELPAEMMRAKEYQRWEKDLKTALYRNERLTLFNAPSQKQYSDEGESESEFRDRLRQVVFEQRDLATQKLREKYRSKVNTLTERLRKAQQRLEVEKQQAQGATLSAALNFGTSILGALLGRKTMSQSNLGKASTSIRSAGRAMDQRGDVTRAQENIDVLQQEIDALEAELQEQLAAIIAKHSLDQIEIEPYEVKPRKADIAVDLVALLWMPSRSR